ncbi:hypothetical protein J1N35_018288 [Gossypium stocksii]|uniref:Uncharacterized protein n=1 Tax=Gossypium stocksii TaxID=47602 RepID=A0A9D4A726_9ROSI|nr:hypothetical protein J1N35_018288 [Gossypium stocksii]
MDSALLQDLSFKGSQFTWKKRKIMEHLDRAISFSDFVKENWRAYASMSTVHSEFTDQVKRWNKDVYGYIAICKKLLTKKLHSIEIKRDRSNSAYLSQVEMEIREDLENVLHHEEIL